MKKDTRSELENIVASGQILRLAVDELGLKRYQLQNDLEWFFAVTDGHKTFVAGQKYGIYPTNPLFGQYFNDKAWAKKVLQKHGFKVVTGNHFFRDRLYLKYDALRSLKQAYRYAEKLGYPVFVKPNRGSLGNGAAIVFNKNQLQRHLQSLPPHYRVFLIEKVVKQPEYRIFIVGGKIMFSYERKRSFIKGDGSSTVLQLLQNSIDYVDNLFLKNSLKEHKIELNSILPDGWQLDVKPQANISAGGHITNYKEKHSRKTRVWAEDIASKTGLHVLGVDVFVKDTIDNPDSFTIIEINTRPMLKGIWELGKQDKVYSIWDRIFKEYFGKDYQKNKKL